MNPFPLKQATVTEQRIGDELYLFSADGETLSVLNSVAMQIWFLCDGTHSASDMVDALRDVYPDVEPSSLHADVADCVRGFREKGLLIPNA